MEASFAASPGRLVRTSRCAPACSFVSWRVSAAALALFCCVAAASRCAMAQQAPAPAPSSGRPVHTPKRAEKEQIEDLEHEFQKAQLSGDVAVMDKLLSDDYLGVNANGELVTKTQQLDHMRSRAVVMTQILPSDVKIKLIGPTAIVTSEVDIEGTLDGVAIRGRYRYTRVYQRVPGGSWKVTSFEATRISRPNA
jgi:ketosteroid isomerase-like protein